MALTNTSVKRSSVVAILTLIFFLLTKSIAKLGPEIIHLSILSGSSSSRTS